MKEQSAPQAQQKKIRKICRLLFGFSILIIVLFATVQYGLGFIVRNAAKTIGPKVVGTSVDIEKAQLRPFFGIVDLGDMVVGPPDGFKANVFEMQNFRIEVAPRSIFTDTIVIREISIINPTVTYELSGLNSNISAILDKLGKAEKQATEHTSSGSAPAKKKVIIESFVFSGAKVRLAATAAGGKGIVVPMPAITLTDIGRKSGGVTGLEAFGQMLRSVTTGILSVVANSALAIGDAVGGVIVKAAGGVGDGVVTAAGAVGSAVGTVGSAVGDGAKAVGGAITSLFGSSDKTNAPPQDAEAK